MSHNLCTPNPEFCANTASNFCKLGLGLGSSISAYQALPKQFLHIRPRLQSLRVLNLCGLASSELSVSLQGAYLKTLNLRKVRSSSLRAVGIIGKRGHQVILQLVMRLLIDPERHVREEAMRCRRQPFGHSCSCGAESL
jgi:hypothetical protein